MTIFDATIFDLVKIALEKNFFKLIHLFGGKQDRIPIEILSQFNSHEDFQESIIDQQLKSKYLKEILLILKGQDILTFEDKDDFPRLIELVLRRNIHVHNRGVVDDKYLEREPGKKVQHNLYNLAPGSIAVINKDYWESANRLCRNCVTVISEWASSTSHS